MVKKYIGSSDVNNGVAEGEFTLPENLPKGVYQLIAEYKGSNIYKPSYDIKQLIIAWLSKLTLSRYFINGNTRELNASSILTGYDDDGNENYLPSRNIVFRIGEWNPNDKRSTYQKYKEAIDLIPYQSTVPQVMTSAYGEAKARFFIPTSFTDEHYYLYAYYEGDNDYISAVAQNDLIIGERSTVIELTVKPSNHIYNYYGSCIVTGQVYLRDDYYSGRRKDNATPITEGKLILKHGNSPDPTTHIVVDGDETYVKILSDTFEEDGKVSFQYKMADKEVKTRYVSAKYSGVTDKYGYSETNSTSQLVIVFDSSGDNYYNINTNFPTLIKGKNALFIEENVPTCHKVSYTTDGVNPVDSGTVTATTYTVETD